MLLQPKEKNNKQFASLQAGRAIASLLVVFFHASTAIFFLPKYWGHDPLHNFFYFGHSGVEFFFVLSGFIILHAHSADIGRQKAFTGYLRKRILRIYPIFWAVLLIMIPVYFLVPSFGKGYETEPQVLISSLLLIHINTGWSLGVSWTLFHEILFYAFFSLAILSLRLGIAAMAAWFIASLFMLAIPAASPLNEFTRSPLDFYLSPLHLLFAIGMLGCWVQSEKKIIAPMILAITGIGLFLAAGLEEDYVGQLTTNSRNLIYGFASILALVGCMELEVQGRLKVPALLQLIGNASYSIYLTHFLFLSMAAKMFFAVGANKLIPALIAYMLITMFAVVGGIAVHLLIEKPLLHKLSRRAKPLGVEAA